MNVTKEFLEKVRGLQTEDWVEVDRLLKTLRYIIGIAERGEGRKCGEDESPEQFVLEYVKKLEAPRASFEMNIPEGWPTDEMQLAGAQAMRIETTPINKLWTANKVFKAMYEAAPTPPAQGQVSLPKVTPYKSTSIPESEWRNEPIDYWLRKMLENCDYHDGLVIEATLNFLGGLKAPAPKGDWEEVQRLLKTIRYVQGIAERGEGRKMRDDETLEQFLLAYVKKLEAPEVEPAYQVHEHGDFWRDTSREGFDFYSAHGGYKTRILYTHPANDGLRKAAEDAVAVLRYLSVDAGLTDFWRNNADKAANDLAAELKK
jgi:hypothetical protein